MSILKSILLTLLSIVILSLPLAVIHFLIDWFKIKNNTFFEHLYGLEILSMLLSYFTVFYFFWKPRPDLIKTIHFKKLDKNLILYSLLIVIGYGFAGQPFWDFDKILNYYQDATLPVYNQSDFKFTPFFFYYNFSTLVIAPIFEELFFRKFLFQKLLQKNTLKISILISSLCFAFIHFPTPGNLIPTFTAGIISCLIFHKTKRIEYSIILHFMNNLFTLSINNFGHNFFNWLYNLKFDFTYWCIVIFGVLIIMLSIKTILGSKYFKHF